MKRRKEQEKKKSHSGHWVSSLQWWFPSFSLLQWCGERRKLHKFSEREREREKRKERIEKEREKEMLIFISFVAFWWEFAIEVSKRMKWKRGKERKRKKRRKYISFKVNEVRRKKNQTEKGRKREKSPKRRSWREGSLKYPEWSGHLMSWITTLFLLLLPFFLLYIFFLSRKKKEKMKKKSLQESVERKILVWIKSWPMVKIFFERKCSKNVLKMF